MNNSNSQKPLDNSALFANCAKEWESYDHENSGVVFEDNTQSNLSKQNFCGEVDSVNVKCGQNEQDRHGGNLTFSNQGLNAQPLYDYSADVSVGNPTLTRLYSALELAFTQSTVRTHSQCEAEARELLFTPQKNYNWHLCLMGYNTSNISENLDCIEGSELHDPLEGAVEWLTEGMKKGWLRHVDMNAFVSPLHYSFLSQEVFWQRFASTCEYRKNRISLVLFKFTNNASKERELRELIEQILIATKKQDFFGEVKGVGVALVLFDSGSFGATACAERIMSRMDSILESVSVEVAVVEATENENAETLFAYGKEVLADKLENRPRVRVYRKINKNNENNSLVQADEKRFLFFGVQ